MARRAAPAPIAAAQAPSGALATLHPASARDAALLAGLLEAPVAAPSVSRGHAAASTAALESELLARLRVTMARYREALMNLT